MSEVQFEKITKYKDIDFPLPVRKTAKSAGYDFTIPEDIVIPSHYLQLIDLIKGKLSSTNFLLKVSDLKAIDILSTITEKADVLTDQEKLALATRVYTEEGKAIVDFLKEEFTMDIEEVKTLTKATNSKITLVPTGVKVKLKDNQKLELVMRSSSSLGAYLMMANSVGIIDADYYNNEDNEGHMFFQIINMSPFNIKLKKGDIIGQGIISTYDKTDDDQVDIVRIGGHGSTTASR